jgi:hypothetical protein
MRLVALTVRIAGLLTGLGLAAAGVLSSPVTGGTGTLGADVQVVSNPVGELDISPIGPFLSATNLEPRSAAVEGQLKARNQTGTELSVRVRALPSVRDLDDLLMFDIQLGGAPLFAGDLRALRESGTNPFRLRPGERGVLAVKTWLPAEVTGGYEGRIADIGLELQVQPIRS